MNRHDVFFNKVLNNSILVGCLKKLEARSWDRLSYKEKVDLFKTMIAEFSSFYLELGTPNFEFVFMDEAFSGEDSEKGTFINAKLLMDGNHFEILAACLHELRHFFQDKACKLYKQKGIVHELFSEEEINSFIINIDRSVLYTADNYLELEDDVNREEYYLQPVEYDAENFSYEFMRRLANNFLKDKFDIMNCRYANDWFPSIIGLKKGNKDDIIMFNKIYYFNYLDRINENKVRFKKEEKKSEIINSWLENDVFLDDTKIFILLSSCFLEKYDDSMKVNLLNKYLEYNDCYGRIEFLDDGYYLDGLLLDFKGKITYEIIEPIFSFVANEKINYIVNSDIRDLKYGFEKEIKINLSCDNNFIKEEDNPLFYRLQPSVLFKNNFIKNQYMKLIDSVDSIYEGYNNYFNEFSCYIKKYDSVSLMKKAEILTGKTFESLYDDMLNKMKANLKNEIKASK